MGDPTPIYTEALREAKRRTRKTSRERQWLVDMDQRTRPRSPHVQLHSIGEAVGMGPATAAALQSAFRERNHQR